MAAISKPGKIREQIKVIVAATTGFTDARAILGIDDLGASVEFKKNIVTDGPYVLIRPAVLAMDEVSVSGSVSYDFQFDVYFGFAGDADYDFTAIEDLLFTAATGLIPKLRTNATWTAASLPVPSGITQLGPPQIQTTHKPAIGRYSFSMSVLTC